MSENKPIDKNQGLFTLWQAVKSPTQDQTVAAAAETAFANNAKYKKLDEQQKTRMFSALSAAAGKPLAELNEKQRQFNAYTEQVANASKAAASSFLGVLGQEQNG